MQKEMNSMCHISLVVVSSGARYKSGNDFVAVNLAARR